MACVLDELIAALDSLDQEDLSELIELLDLEELRELCKYRRLISVLLDLCPGA